MPVSKIVNSKLVARTSGSIRETMLGELIELYPRRFQITSVKIKTGSLRLLHESVLRFTGLTMFFT